MTIKEMAYFVTIQDFNLKTKFKRFFKKTKGLIEKNRIFYHKTNLWEGVNKG
jgi:hypothetical protein